MKELSLSEIQQEELKILLEFHRICVEHEFKYSLCGGTLLGAVRHKGFIPWDDDIDVMMIRSEYERFLSYCAENQTEYIVRSCMYDKDYCSLHAVMINPNLIVQDELIDESSGQSCLYIDIFPVDGLGNTFLEAKKRFVNTAFKRELLVASKWKKYLKSKTNPWYYEPFRLGMYILSRTVKQNQLARNIEKDYINGNKDNAVYMGCLCGSYKLKEIEEKTVFADYTDLQFEGYSFKAVTNYTSYLAHHYGDFMKLPPAEEQISRHYFKVFIKEHS